MKTEKVLLDLIKNNIKIGRIIKKDFEEMPSVYSKSIETPAPAPTPVAPKGIEKLEPKLEPAPVAPKGIEKLEPKLEPKMEPKAEPKIEPSK